MPYGVLLILNQEKHDRQCCYSGEAVLAQGGEGDVRHHIDIGVGLAADAGPRPRLRSVKGYYHANLAPVGSGRSVHLRRSRDGGVRRITLSGTPGSAGLWNIVSHPW
jgi:hypothetical protein